ncbi:MAG: Fic family protein [Pseudomonadota bacterium]
MMAIPPKKDMLLPEIVFSGGRDAASTRRITRLAEDGKLTKLYSGVYTSNLDSPQESIVQRNWAEIVGYLLPDAVLSYRSAAMGKPENGVVYVTRGKTRRQIKLPGLRIEVIPGNGAVVSPPANDVRYKHIYVASESRWLLENLSQGRGVADRVISQQEIEERLEKILVLRGEHRLNELRDQCRALADTLQLPQQFSRLDGLIGALLGTHEQKRLHSKQALARAAGKPYDPQRLELFDVLFARLQSDVMPRIDDKAPSGHALETFAFFESYFSNFIEGTTFEVGEAEQIIFEGAIIPNRSEDSHDVLGTFRAATVAPWRNAPPTTDEEFLQWLKSVNALVMAARPDKRPGEWKEKANQAGSTLFVYPDLVPGTLREGFARISALSDPYARALMTMFVITEVHPFADGNGRTARLAMNCELSAAGLSRIIVPTVYREDYLLPLKSLSSNKDPSAFLKSMTRVQQWTSAFDYSSPRDDVKARLGKCNAFQEDLKNYKLVFPD